MMKDETNTPPISGVIDRIEREYKRNGFTDRLKREQRYALETFAKRHECHVTKRPFSLDRLKQNKGHGPYPCISPIGIGLDRAYDHVEYLGLGRGSLAVAIVTHSYEPASAIHAAAERDGLACRILARSWYYEGTTAALMWNPSPPYGLKARLRPVLEGFAAGVSKVQTTCGLRDD